jgi:hypothetical protein
MGPTTMTPVTPGAVTVQLSHWHLALPGGQPGRWIVSE